MLKLLYGNGNVSLIGPYNIRGLEMIINGNIEIDDQTPSGFAITYKNKKIIIYPVTSKDYLSNLFNYRGSLKVESILVVNDEMKRVPCQIKRVMDFAELLNTTSENITLNSEDLKTGYVHKNRLNRTTILQHTIDNLNTSLYPKTQFKLTNGDIYNGPFHVHHVGEIKAMTGAAHSSESKHLDVQISSFSFTNDLNKKSKT